MMERRGDMRHGYFEAPSKTVTTVELARGNENHVEKIGDGLLQEDQRFLKSNPSGGSLAQRRVRSQDATSEEKTGNDR